MNYASAKIIDSVEGTMLHCWDLEIHTQAQSIDSSVTQYP